MSEVILRGGRSKILMKVRVWLLQGFFGGLGPYPLAVGKGYPGGAKYDFKRPILCIINDL